MESSKGRGYGSVSVTRKMGLTWRVSGVFIFQQALEREGCLVLIPGHSW